MGILILFVLIGIPIAEITVFIEVGDRIGVALTLAITVLTAILGTALLRHQGFSVLARARANLQENCFPVNELFDGLCVMFAGALLLTPGFVTDIFGFLLFVPAVRRLLRHWAIRELSRRGHLKMHTAAGGTGPLGGDSAVVIDGEYHDITKNDGAESDTGADGRRLPPD